MLTVVLAQADRRINTSALGSTVVIGRVGKEGASSWTLKQEQLPSTDMCKVPALHDKWPNPSSLPTWLAKGEGYKNSGIRGTGIGELDPEEN